MADLDTLRLVAMRPLHGLVNEMILDGNVLFAAATHDGLWALDARSETLRTLAHYPTPGDSAAYDLKLVNDTFGHQAGDQYLVEIVRGDVHELAVLQPGQWLLGLAA